MSIDIAHRTIETNGIRMHIAEAGAGPLVLLLHGFPELWYSWRHQIPALAEAGYHVVAPDQRGYGGTDAPERDEAYSRLQLVGDIVGLVRALGESRAAIVGHDWGAGVAQFGGLLRPDVFDAVALLSVPFSPRGPAPVLDGIRAIAGDRWFYQLYFQEPGPAEREFEADVRRTLLSFAWLVSDDLLPDRRMRMLFPKDAGMLDGYGVPDEPPPWQGEEELSYFVTEFSRTGFRGGLNWYRNMDSDWALTPFLAGATLHQPVMFAAGSSDPVVGFYPKAYEQMEQIVPDLRKKALIPNAGHWVQQEQPEAVTALLLEFLAGLAT